MEVTSIDISPIEQAVSKGVETINSAADEAINKIQSTVHEPQVLSSEPVSSEIPEPKTIMLDVVNESELGNMHFKSVKINYEYGSLEFSYTLKSDVFTSSPIPNSKDTACTVSGEELNCGSLGGKGKTIYSEDGTPIGYEGDGVMSFYKFSDNADLSSVTITYAFEGYDPVTIEIDIPLE